jgi:hypothetical protein
VNTSVIPDGSGTLNTIAKWTPDGNSLGNSSITDDGTTVATTLSAQIGNDTADTLIVASSTAPLNTATSSSRLEVTTAFQSLIAIGETGTSTADPAITLYRTSGGARTGTAARIMSGSTFDFRIQQGTANTAYGAETYIDQLTINNAGTLDVNGALAKFGDQDGEVYLKSDEINFQYAADSDSIGYLNYSGYAGSNTRFRSLVVADGKGTTIAQFTGSTKATVLTGTLGVTSSITASDGIILGASGENYIYASLAASSGNQNVNLDAAGTGKVRVNSNAGGLANGGTGGLEVYGGANDSTANITLAGNGDLTAIGALTAGTTSSLNAISGRLNITGTTHSSVFNYEGGATESTYLRGGKTTSSVNIGDVNTGGVYLGAAGTNTTNVLGPFLANENTTLGDAVTDTLTVTGDTTFTSQSDATTGVIVVADGDVTGEDIRIGYNGPSPSRYAGVYVSLPTISGGGGAAWTGGGSTPLWSTALYGSGDYGAILDGFTGGLLVNTGGVAIAAGGLSVVGHVEVTGADPTLSACGTSPTIIGNDTAGTVTMGTGGPSSCTVTFASAYATNAPACIVNLVGSGSLVETQVTAISTSAFTFGDPAAGANFSSVKFSYICIGTP